MIKIGDKRIPQYNIFQSFFPDIYSIIPLKNILFMYIERGMKKFVE